MIFYQKIFDMQLFERIRFFSKSQKIPLARLAEHIGVSPQTFNTWFAEKAKEISGNIFKKSLIFIQSSPENGFILVKVLCLGTTVSKESHPHRLHP